MLFTEDHDTEVNGMHVCPVCAKMFMEEKAFYGHIMCAHPDSQRMAHDMRADLYRRWQERIPRRDH
jgi:uncharacterized C2H2 Zn-finger protein